MREVAAHRSQAITDLARVVTSAGSAYLLVPLALVLCALLLHAGLRAQALAIALTLAGAIVVLYSDVVKPLVSRARPAVEGLQLVTGLSFPSGHATQASAFWLSLVFAASSAGAPQTRTRQLAAWGAGDHPARRAVPRRLSGRPLPERRDRGHPARRRLGRLRRPVEPAPCGSAAARAGRERLGGSAPAPRRTSAAEAVFASNGAMGDLNQLLAEQADYYRRRAGE